MAEKPPQNRDKLLKCLGHSFADPVLLEEALTHPSATTRKSTRQGSGRDYDRLEFLGDRVLGLVIADHLANNPLANDLDLLLLDLNGKVLDLAAGFGPIESLTIPEGGEYIVWVSLCADELLGGSSGICGDGATNYQLNVGQGAPETVPAGKPAISASIASCFGSSLPITFETMCITWL